MANRKDYIQKPRRKSACPAADAPLLVRRGVDPCHGPIHVHLAWLSLHGATYGIMPATRERMVDENLITHAPRRAASSFKRLIRGERHTNQHTGTVEMAGRTLTRTICETIVAILTKNDAEWIAIFGSYARGNAGPASDIDILVRFARKKSLFSLIRIEDELTRALRMKVDLVTENAVSPYLADAIYRDAVVIYDAGRPRVSPSHL